MFSPLLTAAAFASGSPPVAEAGLPLIAYVGDAVILDGSGSSDREGDPLSWQWTQVSGPPVEIDRADSVEPQFSIGAPGTIRIALVVSDGSTESEADEVAVVVPYEEVAVMSGCSTAGGSAWMGTGGGPGGLLLAVSAVAMLRARRR